MDEGQHSGSERRGLFGSFIGFLILLGIILVAAFVLRMYVVAPYEIPSGSMETTIMTQDKVFSEKVSYYTRPVRQGDIVTFTDPEMSSRTLIKRVIALGGQTVDLKDGAVYVDGQKLDESYTNGQRSDPLNTAAGVTISYPYTVPNGYIWVMGDNRTNSADSRYFGAVPASNVTGRACYIYWPFNRVGILS